MEHKDYYKVMGLSPQADEKEIKLAYRRLARKYHPDISKEKDAEAHFKEVGEAYEVLKDPQKRQVYDQYMRDVELNQQARSSSHRPHSHESDAQHQYTYDFFESLFGGQPFQAQRPVNLDLHGSIQVSLEEAVHGTVKEIQLPGAPNAGVSSQTLRVKIPAGVRAGQQIRLAGKGAVGMGPGEQGDLYITIQIDKHPLYDVMGHDVYMTLPVAPWEVALGSTVAVPTLGGKVDLKIPEGSQGGQKLRLKKRGLPGPVPGDQYVTLKIITPQPSTDEARALYKKMAEEMPMNPRAQMGVE